MKQEICIEADLHVSRVTEAFRPSTRCLQVLLAGRTFNTSENKVTAGYAGCQQSIEIRSDQNLETRYSCRSRLVAARVRSSNGL